MFGQINENNEVLQYYLIKQKLLLTKYILQATAKQIKKKLYVGEPFVERLHLI